MKWLKRLIRAIVKALKKIWDKLRPFLGVILMAILVLAPVLAPFIATLQLPAYLSWMPAGLTALGNAGWGMSALVGLGVGAVVAPEAVGDIVDNIGGVVGGVVDNVGEIIGGGANSLIGSLFGGPAGWLILGVGVYFLMSGSGNDKAIVVSTSGPEASKQKSDRVDSSRSKSSVSNPITARSGSPSTKSPVTKPVGVAGPRSSVAGSDSTLAEVM